MSVVTNAPTPLDVVTTAVAARLAAGPGAAAQAVTAVTAMQARLGARAVYTLATSPAVLGAFASEFAKGLQTEGADPAQTARRVLVDLATRGDQASVEILESRDLYDGPPARIDARAAPKDPRAAGMEALVKELCKSLNAWQHDGSMQRPKRNPADQQVRSLRWWIAVRFPEFKDQVMPQEGADLDAHFKAAHRALELAYDAPAQHYDDFRRMTDPSDYTNSAGGVVTEMARRKNVLARFIDPAAVCTRAETPRQSGQAETPDQTYERHALEAGMGLHRDTIRPDDLAELHEGLRGESDLTKLPFYDRYVTNGSRTADRAVFLRLESMPGGQELARKLEAACAAAQKDSGKSWPAHQFAWGVGIILDHYVRDASPEFRTALVEELGRRYVPGPDRHDISDAMKCLSAFREPALRDPNGAYQGRDTEPSLLWQLANRGDVDPSRAAQTILGTREVSWWEPASSPYSHDRTKDYPRDVDQYGQAGMLNDWLRGTLLGRLLPVHQRRYQENPPKVPPPPTAEMVGKLEHVLGRPVAEILRPQDVVRHYRHINEVADGIYR